MRFWMCFFLLMVSIGAAHGEEVAVRSGDIVLKADLLLPPASVCNRCPLLVIVQGSGSSDRSNPWTGAWAKALVAAGVAVIHPDKRGSGKSGGDWMAAGMPDLAEDVDAFVDYAAKLPRVDAARIGVMGFSQGGDVAPVAATRDRRVRYVVALSGSVVPMHEQMQDELELDARRRGFTPAQMHAMRDVNRAALDYARSGKDFPAVEKAMAQAHKVSVPDGFIRVPDRGDTKTWEWLKHVVDFDPLPSWRKLGVPAVFIYGRQDQNVDVDKSVRLIDQNLMRGHAAVSTVVFNENGHGLFRAEAVAFVAAFAKTAGSNE